MRRTNNNRATIPSLNRITDHPRHYHSHINADQQISINMVYDVNRQLPTNAVPQLNNNIQNILSTPPLFDSVKCQTRLISSYIIEKQIGQGGYGKVYKGIDKNNNRIVAIKQMDKRKERNGFSQNALREIKLLREIYHTNSVTLLQIVVGDDKKKKEYKITDEMPVLVYSGQHVLPGDQLTVGTINPHDLFQQIIHTKCDRCDGTGKHVEEEHKCPVCGGERTVMESKTFTLEILPGDFKKSFQYDGEGGEEYGHQSGNLIFFLQILKHKQFSNTGSNLRYSMEVTLVDALVGFEKTITHLDGRNIIVKHDIVTYNGRTITIKGEGLPIIPEYEKEKSQNGTTHGLARAQDCEAIRKD